MGKPRMIILIRHAQSEGNKNRDIHQTTPDHRVKLTAEGWRQAREAGHRLRNLLLPSDTLHFFTSPYTRTRQTTEGILSTLCSPSSPPTPSPTSPEPSAAHPSPSASEPPLTSASEPPSSTLPSTHPPPPTFQRDSIRVYDDPRLREQDFGNYQPCSKAMSRMWAERASYGHFFYRIANGESAADAYDRISGFNESLWRQFGEDECASVVVLVTHGLMARVFLMKWYHYSVEYFEDLRNVDHCEFVIMQREGEGKSGKYILQNQLRTWSQLKKEKRALESPADGAQGDAEADDTEVPTKIWGGCPDGCNHGSKETAVERAHGVVGSDFYPPEHSRRSPSGTPSSKRLKQDGEVVGEQHLKALPERRQVGSPSKLRFRPGRDAGGSDSGVSSETEDVVRGEGDAVVTLQDRAKQPVNGGSRTMAQTGPSGRGGDETVTARADALGDAIEGEGERDR